MLFLMFPDEKFFDSIEQRHTKNALTVIRYLLPPSPSYAEGTCKMDTKFNAKVNASLCGRITYFHIKPFRAVFLSQFQAQI